MSRSARKATILACLIGPLPLLGPLEPALGVHDVAHAGHPPRHQSRCATLSCHERVARKHCAHGVVKACLVRAWVHHHLPLAGKRWMLRVSWCESRWDPNAHNPSGANGLFQFMSATWQATPYRSRSVWAAKWSALAGAWAWRRGWQSQWACR
jgi:hypothetical protein